MARWFEECPEEVVCGAVDVEHFGFEGWELGAVHIAPFTGRSGCHGLLQWCRGLWWSIGIRGVEANRAHHRGAIDSASSQS